MERPAQAEEKIWGWSQQLWEQKYTRADGSLATLARGVRVFIRAGGYSSIHMHPSCHNIFSVTEGRLRLRRFKQERPHGLLTQWTQEPGDVPFNFQAGAYHQFHALTDVLGLEVYIATPQGDAAIGDIVRLTTNGISEIRT